MKTTFYCVEAQYYDYGKRLACITNEKITDKKPKDQVKRIYGQTAFKIWMVSEINAIELVNLILDSAVGIDDLTNLMSAHEMDKRYGRRAA